jgi:glucose-6-phosphate isomerase
MVDLDTFDLARADPGRMLDRIRELPQQVRDAWQAAGALHLPVSYSSARAVLVLGMGGSAIGGDLLRLYAAAECPVPIAVSRDYELPAWVNSDTLVIGVSFSGNTEEALSAFAQAAARSAKLLAISTGGRLAEMAQAHGAPFLQVQYQTQPRAALGYLFTPLVHIASTLGFLGDKSAECAEGGPACLRHSQMRSCSFFNPWELAVTEFLLADALGRLEPAEVVEVLSPFIPSKIGADVPAPLQSEFHSRRHPFLYARHGTGSWR